MQINKQMLSYSWMKQRKICLENFKSGQLPLHWYQILIPADTNYQV